MRVMKVMRMVMVVTVVMIAGSDGGNGDDVGIWERVGFAVIHIARQPCGPIETVV